ncbi:hypothetical protein MJH12_14885, partial [bacterium]|nr:hypothetical protein [bacterium]
MSDSKFLQFFGIALYNPNSIDGGKVMSKVGYDGGYYANKHGVKIASTVIEDIEMSALEDAVESGSHQDYQGQFKKFRSSKKTAEDLAKILVQKSTLRFAFTRAIKWTAKTQITHHLVDHAKNALTGAGFKTLIKHTVIAASTRIFADLLVESAIILSFGQHKEEVKIGNKTFEYQTQKNMGQNDADSYWQDRKFAFLDVMDNYADNKEAKITGYFGGAVALALMPVSIPATILAAAVGYATYSGAKYVMLTERVQNWKHTKLVDRLESMMSRMLYVKKNDKIFNNIRSIAEKRAGDMIKRKEVAKQSLRRIYLVDRLESIQFYQDNKSYWWFKNDSELKGDTFDDEAHAR